MSIKHELDRIGDEAETTKDVDYRLEHRPGRPSARVLSVRFREDEFQALSERAEAEGLPVSTMARILVTRSLVPEHLEEVLRATIRPEFLRDAS